MAPGVEHEAEAEAGGGLDGEPAAADEGAALAVAGAEHAEDEARSSSGRSAVRSSPPMASATEAMSCGVVATRAGDNGGGGAGGLR